MALVKGFFENSEKIFPNPFTKRKICDIIIPKSELKGARHGIYIYRQNKTSEKRKKNYKRDVVEGYGHTVGNALKNSCRDKRLAEAVKHCGDLRGA